MSPLVPAAASAPAPALASAPAPALALAPASTLAGGADAGRVSEACGWSSASRAVASAAAWRTATADAESKRRSGELRGDGDVERDAVFDDCEGGGEAATGAK